SGYLLAQATAEDAPQTFRRLAVRPEVPFVAWVLIACLWSLEPAQAVLKALFLAAVILHVIILSQNAHSLADRDIAAASRGLVAGFLLGGLYLCLEIETRDAVTRLALTHVPELSRAVDKHG